MKTVRAHPKYPKATFAEPTPYGYLYAGVTVDPPGRAPFVRRSRQRDGALEEFTTLARRIESHAHVVKATVYQAVLIPPLKGGPRFDVALLVRTTSPETIAEVQATETYQELNADFDMAARNVRRIGDTDPPEPTASAESAIYLFNHFTAEDAAEALEVWENLTGWYTAKTGIDNSTVLRPLDDTRYAFVNYVRLPRGAARFMFDQFRRPSFGTYVRANLRAHRMVARPVLYKPA